MHKDIFAWDIQRVIKHGTLDEIKLLFQSHETAEYDWRFFIKEAIKYWRKDAVEYLLTVGGTNETSFLVTACIFHNSSESMEAVHEKFCFDDEYLHDILCYAQDNDRHRIVKLVKKILKIKEK